MVAGFIIGFSPVRWQGPLPKYSLEIPAPNAWTLLGLGLAGPALLMLGQVFATSEKGGMKVVKHSPPAQPKPEQVVPEKPAVNLNQTSFVVAGAKPPQPGSG